MMKEKYKFDKPEQVDKKLANAIVNGVPEKVNRNLKSKNLKV